MPILQRGSTGDDVEWLQEQLGVETDGVFGKATEAALKAWQAEHGLKADGMAGPATLALLRKLEEDGDAADDSKPAAAPVLRKAAPNAPSSAPPARATVTQAAAPATAAAAPGKIASWAYQLADIDPKDIAALDVDLVVIDYSRDGEDATAFKAADLARMKKRPGGGSKTLISYMSIGEAEDYRYYWQDAWAAAATRPAWLDDLNPDWEGNYKVRYWDPAWQAVILGNANAYLDRIIAAGFDGVYLDIVDAFEYWQEDKPERPAADKDMIAFVTKIAAYARKKRPGFMVIPQNGEALLEDPAYRKVISAQAKEDIFYGQDGDGKNNKKAAVSECLDNLALARADGIPILAIEYLDDGKKISDARGKLADAGCCAYFGPRDLDEIRADQPKG